MPAPGERHAGLVPAGAAGAACPTDQRRSGLGWASVPGGERELGSFGFAAFFFFFFWISVADEFFPIRNINLDILNVQLHLFY